MTLYLSIKPQYLDQIVRGIKVNEYRELTDYYTRRLVAESSTQRPKTDPDKWVKCTDGKWYKFHKYDFVKFIESGSGGQNTAIFRIKSIDCTHNQYIIRIGERMDKPADDTETKN